MSSTDTEKEISIAVVAKDEERSIGKVLSGIFSAMRHCGRSYELFLVDGYSEDDTVKIARRLGTDIISVKGGKGLAMQKALETAKGEYVLFIDADGSHMPDDIIRLVDTIRDTGADLVIVSRVPGRSEEMGGKSLDNLLRLCGNKLSAFIVNKRWGTRLTDIQNGFRIIRREAALKLDLREKSFSIEQEMVMKALKRRLNVLEIPGTERKRLYGRSKISKRREFWKYLWSFIKNL